MNRLAFILFLSIAFDFQVHFVFAQADKPGNGNPILPGYFADPTIKKFDDIYYIYATTDNEMLASGVPTVWYSDDLQNWYNYTMEVPSLSALTLRNFWAPDIIKGADGKYYLYFGNCQAGCHIYGYVSDSPVGPWSKLHEDDKPVISHNYPREGFPSLDAQFFQDTDGRIYAHWGTWVHYNGGYAVGELNTSTMGDMMNSTNIPLEQTPVPFEAPYMMKRGEKYILMYSGESCHDETYKVSYAYADSPYGPFTPGANNPILSTNEDETVHGPGHHSVLEHEGEYYIVYHKHDYPMTRGGLARQVCMDKMVFENDSTISKVTGTTEGVKDLLPTKVPENIAHQAKVTASSFYQETAKYDYSYKPAFATDNNNATLWKAANNSYPQDLTIDLGKVQKISRVMTEFEFAGYYYQYKLEYAEDGENWQLFADRTENRVPGCPMIDDKEVNARFLKLTILATKKTGVIAGVWNIKVYDSVFPIPLDHLQSKPSPNPPGGRSSNKLLVSMDAQKMNKKTSLDGLVNKGYLGGEFAKDGEVNFTKDEEGVSALEFSEGALVLNVEVPRSLEWNGSFTVATWVKNPEIGKEGECLASWTNRKKFYLANSFNAPFYNSSNYGAAAHMDGHFDMKFNNLPSANNWHFLVLTFDGMVEKIYVDGVLDNSQKTSLASVIEDAQIKIGASDVGEYYSGYMASMRIYDYALSEENIRKLMEESRPGKR